MTAKMPDKELNELHANNPKAGDYWHECFTPICQVVEVCHGLVIYLTPDRERQTWKKDAESKSLADFKK